MGDLKERIERLAQFGADLRASSDRIASLEAEVERLKAEKDGLMLDLDAYHERVSHLVETAKDFRSRATTSYAEGAEAMREACADHAFRIGVRWAEDTEHPPTSRKVGMEIEALIRRLPVPPRSTEKEG